MQFCCCSLCKSVAQSLLLFQFRLKPIVRHCATAHWKGRDKGMAGTWGIAGQIICPNLSYMPWKCLVSHFFWCKFLVSISKLVKDVTIFWHKWFRCLFVFPENRFNSHFCAVQPAGALGFQLQGSLLHSLALAKPCAFPPYVFPLSMVHFNKYFWNTIISFWFLNTTRFASFVFRCVLFLCCSL